MWLCTFAGRLHSGVGRGCQWSNRSILGGCKHQRSSGVHKTTATQGFNKCCSSDCLALKRVILSEGENAGQTSSNFRPTNIFAPSRQHLLRNQTQKDRLKDHCVMSAHLPRSSSYGVCVGGAMTTTVFNTHRSRTHQADVVTALKTGIRSREAARIL